MENQRTSAEFQTESIRQYNMYGVGNAIVIRTDVDRKLKRQNVLDISPGFSTEELPLTGGAIKLSFCSPEIPAHAEQQALNKSAEGVVTSYDEISVQCDIRLENGTVTIQLPRPLFPESIRYGLPINLEVIEEKGMRMPLISVREINPEDTSEIAGEFDAILDSL